jgi:hypothetical protein
MILLLTGCVNPNGMDFTSLNDSKEREKQYLNSICYYLSKTKYPIVFVENSGTDLSLNFDKISKNRLECLTFIGNNNKKRGKGYGECEIIEYAFAHSNIIHSAHDKRIVKITGRHIVRNINTIVNLHSFLFCKNTTFFSINSDLSFPDSRIILAQQDFYKCFLKKKKDIDDSQGFYFEHALLETIKSHPEYPYSPFIYMPDIEGVSGTTGEKFERNQYTISFVFRYAKYAISQKKKFTKYYL